MTEPAALQPLDEHNRVLQSMVRPVNWRNPTSAGRYNLVVIGAGTAGLVTAAGAAGLGAKVALIERGLMGGDCLNVGCVPSKAIISAARCAAAVRDGEGFGVHASNAQVDFAGVMQRMREACAAISPHDSAQRFTQLGVDVYFGQGTFTAGDTVDVEGQTLRFKRAVIATGTRAALPPIQGLKESGYLTHETLFSLTELPRRLVVIGGGPIGCEMAQAFAQLGSSVTLVQRADRVLPREDPDAAKIIQSAMQRDGVALMLGAQAIRIDRGRGGVSITLDYAGQHVTLVADALLVSTGRSPNVQSLGLEQADVRFDADRGVIVNDFLQSNNPNIYAAGDVCSKYRFTHAADFMARLVIQNALFLGRAKVSRLVIPWCTYTSPELAHVGLHPGQDEAQGIPLTTFTQPLAKVDRAVLDGEEAGFVRVHCRRGKDQILGATIVAAHAGDLISQITLAIRSGIGLGKIGSTIHPYPTQADAIRQLGDQYNRTRLTPLIKKLSHGWLAWRR